MIAIWNQRELERPPSSTWRTEKQNLDVTNLMATIERTIKDLESQDLLHIEATILSRLIYRMKCKFRSDKGLKGMEKINRALLNYLSLDLSKEYNNLKNYVELDGQHVILPSRQILEYVLTRTQGFAKLMIRIEEVSMSAAKYLRSRIQLGHAWTISIVAYAVICRIWFLSRHLIKRACIWFNGLYPYLNKFELIGLPWLPEEQKLPDDLFVWLGQPWLSEGLPSNCNHDGWQDEMFKLIKPRDDEFHDETSSFVGKPDTLEANNPLFDIFSNHNTRNDLLTNSANGITISDDIGESISRRDFQPEIESIRETKNKADNCERTVVRENRKKTAKTKLVLKSTEKDLQEKKEISSNAVFSNNRLHDEDSTNIYKNIKESECEQSQNLRENLTLSDITSGADLMILLNKDCYPGLDKLRWNMIKNNSKNILCKQRKYIDKKDEKSTVRKVIRFLQRSIRSS